MSSDSRPKETWAIVPPQETKRAALFFDRIFKWPRPSGLPGASVSNLVSDTAERLLIGPMWSSDWRPPAEVAFGSVEDDEVFQTFWSHVQNEVYKTLADYEFAPSSSEYQHVVDKIAARYGAGPYATLYSGSRPDTASDYGSNIEKKLEAVLHSIPVIDRTSLSWDHILEFRKDAESVRKYRDLNRWLARGLQANSVSEAEDIIAQTISDYKETVKEWRFNTTIGAIRQLFVCPNIEMAIGLGAPVLALGGPVWASIAASSFLMAKVGIFVAESVGDLQKTKRGFRQIAILIDIEEKLGLDN